MIVDDNENFSHDDEDIENIGLEEETKIDVHVTEEKKEDKISY